MSKDNPYRSWSITRLVVHKEKIEIALKDAMLKAEGLSAERFREVHSRPQSVVWKLN